VYDLIKSVFNDNPHNYSVIIPNKFIDIFIPNAQDLLNNLIKDFASKTDYFEKLIGYEKDWRIEASSDNITGKSLGYIITKNFEFIDITNFKNQIRLIIVLARNFEYIKYMTRVI
jgi:hypothetical protein